VGSREAELVEACLDACRPTKKAYKGIIRRNVAAVCYSHGVEDEAVISRVFEETLKRLRGP